MFFDPTIELLVLSFIGATALGAVAHKTNFCPMGAVSDWINVGNTARLGAWFFSIAVAVFGVLILELVFSVPLDSTLPPYRSANFNWLRYLLGGLMFGIGMTLAGGCGSKTLINIGAGSLRSLFVLLVAGTMAHLMTSTAFYEYVFHNWISATSFNLQRVQINNQSLTAIASRLFNITSPSLHWITGSILGGLFLFMSLRSKHFRSNKYLMIGSGLIGLIVVFGWYITGGAKGQALIESVQWMDQRPLGIGVQSYGFINSMGELLHWLKTPGNTLLITFGLSALFGVLVGSLISALATGNFRITWFTSWHDVTRHFTGAVLMGVGGILGMGCTIGQGITGVSTLAIGSLLTLAAIIFGSAITLRTSYYRMVYQQASFISIMMSTLVDFRILPKSLRSLETP